MVVGNNSGRNDFGRIFGGVEGETVVRGIAGIGAGNRSGERGTDGAGNASWKRGTGVPIEPNLSNMRPNATTR